MGLRGPQPTPAEELIRRGSSLARKKKPRELPAARNARPFRLGNLDETIRLIPGFDPFRDAGDCRFDPEAAKAAIRFYHDRLVHVRGHMGGQPLELQPWQQAVVANQYGWKRKDGTRRFREIFQTVARKNGKTTVVAGSVLLEVAYPLEQGAEIYSAAGSRDQASLIFSQASAMTHKDAELSAKLRVYDGYKSIQNRDDSLTVYKSISSDAGTAHGYNPQFVAVDELHTQPKRDLVDALKTGMGARKQPQITYITTAGYDVLSICHEIYDYACRVCDGSVSDSAFLPVIYEVPKDADWTDRELWKLANPNLGVSVQPDFLEAEFLKAEKNPEYENTFRRLFLNQWVEQEDRWISVPAWKECGTTFTAADLEGRECYGGLDLSYKNDLSSLALCFPPRGSETQYRLLVWHWLPGEEISDKEQKDRAPYRQWAKDGWVSLCGSKVVQYSDIEATILALADKFQIQEIAYDPWNANELVERLDKHHGINTVEVRQGMFSMSPLTKAFERLVIDRRLEHNNSPTMLWEVSMVSVERDTAGNIMPNKKIKRARIDGVVAAVMAVGHAVLNVEPTQSVYAEREPLVLDW